MTLEKQRTIELGFEYVTGEYNDVVNSLEREIYHIWGRCPSLWGRGLAWTKIRAWGVRGPGFKSPRPHQTAYFKK